MRTIEKVGEEVEKLHQKCEQKLGSAADQPYLDDNSEDQCPDNEEVGLDDFEQPRSCDEALWEAAEEGDLAKLEAALDRGASVNAPDPFCDNYTALHFLSVSDNADGVELLACRGADLGSRSTHGETPLHLACAANAANATRRLLQVGAPREERDKWGKTPLDVARDGENAKAVAALGESLGKPAAPPPPAAPPTPAPPTVAPPAGE